MLPGGKSDNYSDLMSLVQAQQTRLQSQQAEIKHVSNLSFFGHTVALSAVEFIHCCAEFNVLMQNLLFPKSVSTDQCVT